MLPSNPPSRTTRFTTLAGAVLALPLVGFVQLASSVASASRVRNGERYGNYDSMLAVPALLTDMVFLMWICEYSSRTIVLKTPLSTVVYGIAEQYLL